MALARFGLVLVLAGGVVLSAIPAEGDDFRDTLAALRKAKTKEERLAALKGKAEAQIETFLVKLYGEQDAPLARGEFAEVEQLQQWAEEATTLVDPDRKELFEAICQVGWGRLEVGKEHFDEAAAIYKKLLVTANKPQYKALKPAILLNLAAVQSRQGDFLGGLKTIEEARALLGGLEDAQRELVEAKLLGNLGHLHTEVGDYAEAVKTLEESLRLAEKNKDAEAALISRVNLAAVAVHRGQYAEAIRAYEALRDDCRKAGNVLLERAALNDFGMALSECGRFGDALRALEQARKLAEKLKHRRGEALALYNLAITHFRLGADEEAGRYLGMALPLFQAVGDKVGAARCLKLMGLLQDRGGNTAEAGKTFAECLALIQASGSQADSAELLVFLSQQFREAGQPEKAARALAEAAKAYKKLGDRGRLTRVRLLQAVVKQPDGKWLIDFDELAALKHEVERLGNRGLTAFYHDTLARSHFYRNEWAEAVGHLRIAIEAAEQRVATVEDPQLQIAATDPPLLALYPHLAAALAAQGDAAAAFAAIDRGKARALANLLQRSRASVHKGMTQEEQKEEETLREVVMAAAGKSESQMRFANATPGKEEALKKELKEAEAKYEEFQRKLSLAHPELRGLRGELPAIDLIALQKTLLAREPDLAILSYLAGWDRVLIAVVTAGDKPDGPARVTVHSVMVEEKELASEAEKFWKLCQNPRAGRPVSDKLYKWLVEPAEKDIVGKKHLLVAPCHPLLAIPFQALAKSLDDPYLIEQYAVSYAPSVSALLEMSRRGNSVRGPGRADRLQVLAVGAVNFTDDLTELPASGPEAEAVARVFGERSRLLLAEKATRPAVMKAMPEARFLHIATHGLANASRPLFSALAVTPLKEKADDGRLYAHDVMNLDLTAELVVLSACETGRGRDYRGEGTVGLAWAFFVAGTPAAVVSQWRVSDRATGEFMRAFYDRLREGKDPSKAESLRQAALALLNADGTRHPKYWAPFVLTGDWKK